MKRGIDRGLGGSVVSMVSDNQRKLEQRVVRAAEAALAERRFVTAVDVLVGIGWLSPPAVDRWRQGRVEYLEREVQANLHKISTAMSLLRRWAERRDLQPSETAYVARTRDRRPLRFSASGNPDIERAYRTHWVSPEPSEAKRAALVEAVRHGDTAYDELLMTGLSRTEARQRVRPDVQLILDSWRSTTPA